MLRVHWIMLIHFRKMMVDIMTVGDDEDDEDTDDTDVYNLWK